MIKQVVTAVAFGALLAGCTCLEEKGDWSRNCERNYSLNDREQDTCKEKVEKQGAAGENFADQGHVTLAPSQNVPGNEVIQKSRDTK